MNARQWFYGTSFHSNATEVNRMGEIDKGYYVEACKERDHWREIAQAKAYHVLVDIENLRYYAKIAREFKWQTDVISPGVIEATLNEIANRLEAHEKDKETVPLQHGVNCGKRIHGKGTGHLHGPDDDTPYDVDGVMYCGRCHVALGMAP